MHLFKLTNEQLAQMLIPKRFVPEKPPELKEKMWNLSLIVMISLN
jgi:hypothetical protein